MIVAHLFIREDKHKSLLMCETTATDGMTTPYVTPECLFEVDGNGDLQQWTDRAKQRILRDCPDLEVMDVANGKRASKNRRRSIDIILRRKKKGLLCKLGIKK